jgi:hypothetical protein
LAEARLALPTPIRAYLADRRANTWVYLGVQGDISRAQDFFTRRLAIVAQIDARLIDRTIGELDNQARMMRIGVVGVGEAGGKEKT